MQVLETDETFSIHFINLFGSGGSGGKPAVFSTNFKSSNGCFVGGCVGEDRGDGFAGESFGRDIFWHERGELPFFFTGGRRIDSFIVGASMALLHRGIVLPGILLGCGANFGGKKGENDTVFIGAPNGAILPQKRGTGRFFTSKGGGAVEKSVNKPFETDRNLFEFAV